MTRHAFTLLELVISSVLLTIVMAAASSLLFASARAVPAGDDPAIGAAQTLRALDLLASELSFAISVQTLQTGELTFTIPDRDSDGSDDVMRYSWSGVAGDPWTRQQDADNPEAIVASMASVAFAPGLTPDGTSLATVVVTAHPARTRASAMRTTIRLVNRPAAP
ncbi:MAG: prepilin-type N-terminal cleavage/methylation domain-containing protein [Phycisphaerales bacterium JB039]